MARPQWTLKIEWHEQNRWSDPELTVTVFQTEMPYAVAVELRRDEAGPYVTGVAVRRHIWADGWGGERTHVSPRDIQRLPLARIVQAALAAAAVAEKPPVDEDGKPIPQPHRGMPGVTTLPLPGSLGGSTQYDPGDDPRWVESGAEWAKAARRVLVPHGRPQHGKSTAFYRQLADSYRAFAQAGTSPVREIARRKRVPENTVHQWIHRARTLGFLEPSPRSRRKDDNDDH